MLILGGNGYLGRTLCEYFEGCHIIDFNNNLTQSINFLDYDINNIVEYDIVIDLMNPSNNVIASLYTGFFNKVLCKKKNMIQILRQNNKKYVLASSAYTYYNNNNYNIDSMTMSFDNYSKYLSNMESITCSSDNNLIIRLSSLMGVSNGYVKSGLFINEYAKNNIKTIYGGEQWRNFLHVKDASQLIYESVMSNKFGILNLAGNQNHQLKEFVSDNIMVEDKKDDISFATQDFFKDYKFISIQETLQELNSFYIDKKSYCTIEKYKRILG